MSSTMEAMQYITSIWALIGLIVILLATQKSFREWITKLFIDKQRQQWREDIKNTTAQLHSELTKINNKLDLHITEDTMQAKRQNLILMMMYYGYRSEYITQLYEEYVKKYHGNGFVCKMYEELPTTKDTK